MYNKHQNIYQIFTSNVYEMKFKHMRLDVFGVYIFLLLFGFSCNNNDDDPTIDEEPVTNNYSIDGFVHKGPFLLGSEITLLELNENLSMTGNTFTTQTISADGSFQFQSIELSSSNAEISGRGFYFNEVLGEKSAAQIFLSSLVSLSNDEPIYVNTLTHLEKSRAKVLLEEDMSIIEAKAKAQQEVLQIFEINEVPGGASESLDVFGGDEDDAKLLAISIILQGRRTEAELSELLARMQADIADNGILDEAGLGSALINDVKFLDLATIRSQVESRAQELNLGNEIPNFEKYINNFIQETDFEFTVAFDFPEQGLFGPNLLALNDQDTILPGQSYSLAAVIPENGTLKVRFYSTNNTWFYVVSSNNGWLVSEFQENTTTGDHEQTFTTIESGQEVDLHMGFSDQLDGIVQLDIFENSLEQPTQRKSLFVKGNITPFVFPERMVLQNLLFEEGNIQVDTGAYTIAATANVPPSIEATMNVTLKIERGEVEINPSEWEQSLGWTIDNPYGTNILVEGQEINLTTNIGAIEETGGASAFFNIFLLNQGKLSLNYLSEDLKKELITNIEWQ